MVRPRQPPAESARPRSPEADVVLDVAFEHGLLFLDLVNLGELPAHRVRVRFEPSFRGLGGERRTSSLALFRRLEFLAPGKRIRAFLDRSDAYFAREEPTTIVVTVRWRTDEGADRSRRLRHDLEVYRDLGYIDREVPDGANRA